MAAMPIARWDPFVRGPTLCAFEERWFILFKKSLFWQRKQRQGRAGSRSAPGAFENQS